MTASNPPPGWYPDPAGAGGVRYWDGGAWTPHVQPAGTSRSPAPIRPPRPGGWLTWVALLVVGVLLAVLAWQLVGAIRQPGAPRTPPTAPAQTGARASAAPAPPSVRLPGPDAPASVPEPTLTMDTGCPDASAGRLRSRLTSLTLPTGWQASDAFLSFDCSTAAVADRLNAFAGVGIGSVDPTWGLDDEEVVAWAWDDLGIAAPLLREVRSLGVVGSRPALLVTRVLAERIEGVDHTTEVRIGVINTGSQGQEVVITALSVAAGAQDARLAAEVEAIWQGVRIGG